MGSIPTPSEIQEPVTESKEALHLEKEDFTDANESLSNRLTRLALLSTLHGNQTHPLTFDVETVYQCLDTLESILDPRSNLTREISLCRPPHARPGTAHESDASKKSDKPRASVAASNGTFHPRSLEVVPTGRPSRLLSGVAAVYDEVKMLGEAFVQRREETFHIYRLYGIEQKRLGGRIVELEAELEKLRADMQEDLAEREALQGTVRGLEAWFNGWQDEYELAYQKKPTETARQNGRGWWSRKKVEKPDGFDAAALFDGVTAWMRGWKDFEEEFHDRDRARKLRRESRQQSQHITDISRRSDVD
ncbi:hypothetical protein BDW62DRAFT_199023 [Aspergillus aurantiobrunneus]